jgi:hypothetical protein
MMTSPHTRTLQTYGTDRLAFCGSLRVPSILFPRPSTCAGGALAAGPAAAFFAGEPTAALAPEAAAGFAAFFAGGGGGATAAGTAAGCASSIAAVSAAVSTAGDGDFDAAGIEARGERRVCAMGLLQGSPAYKHAHAHKGKTAAVETADGERRRTWLDAACDRCRS